MNILENKLTQAEKAIAILEVQAVAAAIAGLDAMVKAADVRLIHTEKRLGGRLVAVVVDGTVSAVTSALDAGREEAAKVGNVMAYAVIPRPHTETQKYLYTDPLY